MRPIDVADEHAEDSEAETIEEDNIIQLRIEELEKELQYSKAETANAIQRAARDKSEALRYGGSSLARRVINSVELLSKAIQASEGEDGAESVIEGVKLTLDGLKSSLEAEGIIEIEALKSPFDPTSMEAIATVACPEGEEPGNVIQVVERGYRMHDRVLRAARVIVAEGDS